MANICLDGQIFYTPPVVANPKPANRSMEPPTVRCPQSNTIVISDDESDCGLDDGQSDASLPSLDELLRRLARRKDAEPASVIGMCLCSLTSDESLY